MIHETGKIKLENRAQSRLVQEKLFELGYQWANSTNKSTVLRNLDSPHIYWYGSSKVVTFSDRETTYKSHENKEHLITDFNETEKMEQLKIEKQRLLEAAASCPQAKATLKILFPEAFGQYSDLWEEIKKEKDRSKVFKPIEVTFTIKNCKELIDIYQRMNTGSGDDFKSKKDQGLIISQYNDLWEEIKKAKDRSGVDPYQTSETNGY